MARTSADRGPRYRLLVFQQLAKGPSSLDSHRDSVHGDAIGFKSYFTDAKIWHLHLSIFLADKQCVVQTEEMSVLETEEMSAVETGQMSAVPESSGLPSACGAYEEAPAGV